MSRPHTAKPESYPDAAGVNPAGIVEKRQGLPWEASGPVRWNLDYIVRNSGGRARRSQQRPYYRGWGGPGRAELLSAGRQAGCRWAWSRGKA